MFVIDLGVYIIMDVIFRVCLMNGYNFDKNSIMWLFKLKLIENWLKCLFNDKRILEIEFYEVVKVKLKCIRMYI